MTYEPNAAIVLTSVQHGRGRPIPSSPPTDYVRYGSHPCNIRPPLSNAGVDLHRQGSLRQVFEGGSRVTTGCSIWSGASTRSWNRRTSSRRRAALEGGPR